MKKYIIGVLMLATPLPGAAQYFQYSQYNFTDPRVNPAMVASSDHASLAFIFRNQSTGATEVQLKSSMLSAVYPFLNKRSSKRWSGMGVSFMDDRSGGIFSVQEASISYAINIFLSRFQSLSLGFKALYQKRSVDLGGLYTGSQYVHDRGFDFSMSNGERMGLLRSDFATFSSGLHWQQVDRKGERIAYWGIAFFDLNRPQDSFYAINNVLSSTWVASGGLRLYHENNVSFYPEFLFTRSSAMNVLNVGAITSYELKPYPNQIAGRVDLITKYVPGRSGILGMQFHRGSFSIGFTYDLPVGNNNPGNTGAFEVGMQLRQIVDPDTRMRAARNRRGSKRSEAQSRTTSKSTLAKPLVNNNDRSAVRKLDKKDSVALVETKQDLKTSLKQKTDSVVANARAGRFSHEPFVIERLNLQFNFGFNSIALEEPSQRYLDDLSEALKENSLMKVQLTGHTDNVGSATFNMRLSLYRANVIRQYLIERGVEPSRIQTDGKGLSQPLNGNRTEAERALNRRVELIIYYQE
jgi:type IX secretion system PorP/SprF family membrane protein